MLHKTITLNDYEFKISYLNKSHQCIIDDNNVHDIITATYIPTGHETELQSLNIFNENQNDIFTVIFEIIKENKEFYNQFNIHRNFSRTSWSGVRFQGQPITLRLSKSLEINSHE